MFVCFQDETRHRCCALQLARIYLLRVVYKSLLVRSLGESVEAFWRLRHVVHVVQLFHWPSELDSLTAALLERRFCFGPFEERRFLVDSSSRNNLDFQT